MFGGLSTLLLVAGEIESNLWRYWNRHVFLFGRKQQLAMQDIWIVTLKMRLLKITQTQLKVNTNPSIEAHDMAHNSLNDVIYISTGAARKNSISRLSSIAYQSGNTILSWFEREVASSPTQVEAKAIHVRFSCGSQRVWMHSTLVGNRQQINVFMNKYSRREQNLSKNK